tara:strand:+ start:446 stop:859 length:414 start_codon:yes stop_codon:yes gene_type:complete
MASVLKVNTLTGVTTAGSIVVTGEGNSTTTNLQQGLAKAWGQWNASQALQGSFNCASITDTATGRATFAIATDMANDDYSIATAGSNGSASATIYSSDPNTLAAATFIVNIFAASNGSAFALADRSINLVVVHGDLA